MQNSVENFGVSVENPAEKRVLDLEKDLAEAQREVERLKRVSQQANELVSMATHQIRGPLGAVRGYISLINEGDYGEVPARLQEPLGIIYKSMDLLGKTVNDFLDASRIEQGEMRYYRKDFDLVPLVTEVVVEMKKIITDAGLELRLNISAEPLLIHGDKAKIKHVLLNLVDNAVKYTKQGWVEIRVERINEKILFAVKDSGVGIRPETMPALFQRFSRDVDANKANVHGTGLGLYVAKKMLEAQNGRIWAESAGEGQGAQFYVELPSI